MSNSAWLAASARSALQTTHIDDPVYLVCVCLFAFAITFGCNCNRRAICVICGPPGLARAHSVGCLLDVRVHARMAYVFICASRSRSDALCNQAGRRRRQLLDEATQEHDQDPRRGISRAERGARHVQARTLLLMSCQHVEVGSVAGIFLSVCMLSASVCSQVRACVWLSMRARACAAQGLAAGLSRLHVLYVFGVSFLTLLGFAFCCEVYISGVRATSSTARPS
jgi:hypothetical protein